MDSREKREGQASLHRKAYDALKAAVQIGELRANQRLLETELAGQLGLSRTPVREALRLLENEGVVEHTPGKGWKVSPISLRDIHEIFEVKLVLEPYVSERAAALATPEERADLLAIVDRMTEAERLGDIESWLRQDEAFHALLFSLARNVRLTQTLMGLNGQWYRVRAGVIGMTRRMKESLQEHRDVAECVARGNPEEARRISKEHLERVLESIESVYRGLQHFRTEGL